MWKFFNAWTNNPRIKGRPQKTTKHGICKTFKNFNIDTHMNEWIKVAGKGWGDLVEWKLGLALGTYVPFKSRNG